MAFVTRLQYAGYAIKDKGLKRAITDRLAREYKHLRLALLSLKMIGPVPALRNFSTRLRYKRQSSRGASVNGAEYRLHAKGYGHPLYCRYGASDVSAFWQIFGEREYSCLDDISAPTLIVDCGANVGYSAAYLLNRFPSAHLIAIEPDEGNFRMIERNLKPFADRVTLIQTGVWTHKTGLIVCRGEYRDGLEWSIQVRASQPGETPDLYAMDIGTILAESGFDTIDILKIDIEGSEKIVFSAAELPWLAKVRNMVIELHDPDCETTFFRALEGYAYTRSASGELTVCKDIHPKQ